MDDSNDFGYSSSSDEGRMQIDESAGRSDDEGPKNIVQPPSVFETLKENDDDDEEVVVEEGSEEEEEDDEDDDEDDEEEEGDEDEEGEEEEETEDDDDDEEEEEEEWEEYEEDDVDAGLGVSAAVESDDGDEDPCPICLNKFRDQDQGTPESCDHHFCLECIQEWAKNVNTCPVDRQVFRLILAKHAGDDAVYRRITVEDKNKQEEAEDELTYCEVCGRCDREDRLLLCDGCDLGYHLECLTPPLSVVPVDEWFCSDCAAANKGTSAVTSEEEEEVVRPRRRLIARTLVSERVRTLIHQTRLERARQRRILSSSEDENATAPKRATPKKPPVKRKVIKRRKTRRRRRVRKTKTGAKKGTKTKGRKRKTRRRKTRKGLKRRKIKRLTARTPVVKTVKTRIAEKLGLSKPPVGLSIPLQKLPTGKSMDMQRAEIGISSFSILGHKDDLEPVYEDENESEEQPGTSSSCPVTSRIVKYSKSSLLSRKPVFKISTTAERVSNPSTTNAAPSATTSAASVDILGSIMQGQSFLHMQSKDVTIHKDGSLKPNKEVPEAKISEVKDNRIFELNTFRKDSETKESKEEESYSNPLQPDQTSPDNTADTSHEKSDSDYLTVFGIGEENSKEKGKEEVSSKDKENENIYDPSEPTEDMDIFPEESVPVNKSAESKKNSDTSSKLPVHSDISDDDSSSEKRVVVEKDSSLMIELSRTDDNTPDSQNSQSRRQSFQEGGKKTDVPAGKEAEDEKASFEDGEILRTEEDTRESPGRWSVDSDESALEKEYQMRMQEFAKLSKKEKKVHRRMEADQVEEGEESVFDRLNFGEYDARAYRSREKKESRRRRKREQEEKKEKLLLSRHDSKRENLKVHEEVKSDRESLKVYDDVRCEKDEIYVYEECEVPAEKREKSKHDKHSKSEQYTYESDTHVKRKHRRDKSRSQSRSREKVRTRSHSKDRYRTRSRSREKHKSRSVSRGRHKSRSRSKEKHGTHSKERQSTRSHDRSRRKRRERDRSGSKERSPERERSSKKKKRDKDRERERDRSREKTDRKNWHSRTPSDSPSPVKHSDKDSLSKENRHHHKRKSSRLDDYDDFPVAEKTKKTKSIETAKPHFEKTMKVIEHTCNCNDPIVIDDDDDEDGVEDSVIFGSIGVNFEDIPTPSMPPPPKKDTACATKDKVSSPANKDSSKSAESDGKIPTIIDQKVQANEDTAGKKDGKEKKIPTIIDKVASDTNEKKLEADIEGEMHNYDPAHPTDEELEKEILEFSHSNHQASDTLSSVPPLPHVNSPIVNNRMGFPSVEPANIPLPPASSLPHISTLPQVSTFPPSSLPSVSPLPPVSFNMIPTVPTSIVQAPVLVNPLLLNGPVQFQPLPRIPAAGPAPQFGWPVNSTQVMPVQNQFGPPIVTRPPIMSTIPQALLNGGISEIPADTDNRFPQNIPVNNPTSSMPMTLNPTNQISVGAAQGLSPRPTDTLLSASKILASANNKETEKPALPIQQLQNISTLLKVQACLAGKNSKHDGVFKVPQPVSSSKHKSRENEDPLDSMEMIDMELSPLDEECELVLPTPPDPVNKNRKSRKSKHSHSKSVKALASQQDDMPSSAAELTNKEKYLKKLHLQERVVDEVKCAIKPYYSSKKITKEEYKEILRKAVPKVCHSKAGEINPMKIKSLVDAYVNKFHKRRHGSSKKSKKDESKANGMKTKASR